MTRMTPKSARREAFTLVEVLASLVLVAIILPVAMKGISIAAGVTDVATRRMEAAGLADSVMAELIASGDLSDGQIKGDFGEDYPRYTWEAEVAEWEETYLNRVDVTVAWISRGKERSVTLSTLVYNEEAAE